MSVKYNMVEKIRQVRLVVQWLFMAWVIWIGVRFGLFVSALEHGSTPFFRRPPGVEGFLPIGALTSLKHLLATGEIHPVHPAALVIFLAVLLMSLLAKKSFCSWICPIGTISEHTYKTGARLFGCNFRIWRPLDLLLQGVKYLILFFFIKVILIDMPPFAVAAFLDAPYWAASDIKMMRFFTHISGTALTVIILLTAFSLIYRNFWCRYLCPYGALLGLASFASLFRIRRDQDGCINCEKCSKICPAQIPVHTRNKVWSPECTGCLSCVSVCPQPGVLAMQPCLVKKQLPIWSFPVLALGLFFVAIAVGMVSGHWHSSLNIEQYRGLLPMLPYLTH